MPKHIETFSYVLDMSNKQVLIRIPFNFFLKHANPEEGITIYPEQLDDIKEKITFVLLENDDETTPSS